MFNFNIFHVLTLICGFRLYNQLYYQVPNMELNKTDLCSNNNMIIDTSLQTWNMHIFIRECCIMAVSKLKLKQT